MNVDITTLGLWNLRALCGGGVCFGVRSPGNMMWTAAKLNWSQHQTEVSKTENK